MLILMDLSNLCRDERFLSSSRAADLSLLDRFVVALPAVGITAPNVHSVADRSLMRFLSPGDVRRARSMEQAGRLEFSAVADERILDLTFGPGADQEALVASMDNFDDFRRGYPDIQRNRDRFLGWSCNDEGELVVIRRDMGFHDHQRLSRKEESAELKARRLRRRTLVRQAARHHYRCVNSDCLLAQLWPDHIPDLPRYDDKAEAFVCPSCLRDLVRGALREPAVQLIVFLGDVEQFRVLVDRGERVALGRRDSTGCIGLQARLPDDAADAVSRAHAAFTFDGNRVGVEDLGSRNGTVLRHAGQDRRLAAHHQQQMDLRATVALPGGITVERSGRSHPQDGERAADASTAPEDDRATRLLVTRR